MSVGVRPTAQGALPIGPIGVRRRWPETVDDVSVRLIAALVLVVVAVAVTTQQWWLFVPLFADFLGRTVGGPRWGLTSRVVTSFIRPRVKVAPRPTASTPKRFAAGIGATMTGLASAAWLVGVTTGAGWPAVILWAVGAIMLLFPALEAFLGLCVGCKLFALLARIGLIDPDLCVDCA